VLGRTRFIIGANGATSLLEGLAQVTEPGIVISSDPVYYIYSNFLERRGFEIVAVPEDDQGLRPEALEEKLASLGARKRELRFIYLVTVNNPTCSVLANDRRRRLVEIATDLSRELGRKVPLILDKAYEDLVHDPDTEKPESGLLWDKLGIVYELGTVSKILAPALRIGYMMGPDSELLRVMVQRISDVGFSAPLVNQEVASYLLDHHIKDQLERVNAGYREKARAVGAWIDEYLGEFTEHVVGGRAGFYFYLTFKGVETHERSPFFKYLSRTTGEETIDGPAAARKPRVVYIPGEFCVHPRGDLVEVGRRQLRISYGFEEAERIGEAIRLMREAALYSLKRGS
jgi:2-aminoadipate transaminase